ncbi:hypothetical protein IW139_000147 [Coemansia sp. RSA 353]|nr:hypothetical protein LPJ67_000525 [Coemansia sp. RSA 1938]KAJ2146241.1 hypothetical protein IW142_002195 [Coemansia sp. RSA 564]KAJ2168987.1 hypothetical protein GGH15_000947 [Coemansia sp. RSA 562]KAJ2184734.1 hypothetical protein EV181_004223 [Coemansia sp. RSA 532]KAJ2207687.1 hypothetical protein IW145_001282 [Coemansia sp. RSA 521]KAJ2220936.1 hypothetical protein EV180_004830 [Coemansia sp. RSA 518]KAJ2293085.1 hypothetical protein IW141_001427 [Coemansia sp. RSA 355]KAJ2301739.1 hy
MHGKQPPPAGENTADTNPHSDSDSGRRRQLLRQMHSERDHYWASGGIPPHRVKDSRTALTEQQLSENNGASAGLCAAMVAEIEVAGDLPESAALSITSGDADAVLEQVPGRDFGLPEDKHDTAAAPRAATTYIWPLKNSIAGAGAGCVSSVVTCPLDVVKTRLQYQGVLAEKYRQTGYRPYTGTISTLRRIVGEEGPRGLYRGLAPMLMGYLPTWGLYFAAYETLKHELSARAFGGHMSATAVHVVSAMGAGASASILTNPIWVLKSRFMTQSAYTEYRYTSMRHAVQMIYRAEGLRGFYKGLGSSLLGVTHVAVQFPLYEHLKLWMNVDADHQLESSRILLASAMSKMVASSVTYPHEVIRTRLQNQATPPFKYTGILHAARLIYCEEGMRAFYRGLPTNLIRTVPASMMTLLTYECLIRFL